jgi:hypothetical protein
MPKRAHQVAGVLATLSIATFFLATLWVELTGSHQAVAALKSLIVMPGLLVLVPAVAITGGSGFFLSRSRHGRLVDAKKRRMPFIAGNGLLIFHHRVQTTGFQPVSFSSKMRHRRCRAWTTGMEVIRSIRSSTTSYG